MDRHLYLTAILCLLSLPLAAQSTGDGTLRFDRTAPERVSLPAPEAASAVRDVNRSYNYSTGQMSVSIPLMSLTGGDLTLPISMSYSTGALRLDEESGEIGVRWSLNAGGYISRTVVGLPDECATENVLEIDHEESDEFMLQYLRNLHYNHDEGNLTAAVDAEYDRYSFSVGGYSGQFIIRGSEIIQLPVSDVMITRNADNTFRLVIPDGTVYYFDVTDKVSYHYSKPELSAHEPTTDYSDVVCMWRPGRIVNATATDSIVFTYSTLPDKVNIFTTTQRAFTALTQNNATMVQLNGSQADSPRTGISSHQYTYTDRHRIASISSRGGTLVFTTNSNGLYTSITHRSIDNNEVRQASLTYSSYYTRRQSGSGYRTEWLLTGYSINAGGTRLDGADFGYNSAATMSRKDMFGHCNSTSSSVSSPHESILDLRRECDVISGSSITDYILAPSQYRAPSFTDMQANSLKSIESDAGVRTVLTYEPMTLASAWNVAGHLYDLTIGMRVSQETVYDSNTGNTVVRTLTYENPAISIDFASFYGSNYISLGGNIQNDFKFSTGATLTASSRQPGESPENATVYYGRVTETVGDGSANAMTTVYEYYTDDVTTAATSACGINLGSSWTSDNRYCAGGHAAIISVPNIAYLTAYNAIFSQQLLLMYYPEQFGERAPLKAVTVLRGSDINDPLSRTEYHYTKVNESQVPMKVYSELLTRTRKIVSSPDPVTVMDRLSDFNYFTVYADAYNRLCDNVTETVYGENGISRTVTRSTNYIYDGTRYYAAGSSEGPIGPFPHLLPSSGSLYATTGYRNPTLPQHLSVECEGDSIVTDYGYSANCSYSSTSAVEALLYQARLAGRRTLPRWVRQRSGSSSVYCVYDYAVVNADGHSCGLRPSHVRIYNGSDTTGTIIDRMDILSYDRYGNPLSVQRNNGPIQRYEWSSAYNGLYPTSARIGNGPQTRYEYLPQTGCSRITSPALTVTEYGYDASRLSSVSIAGDLLTRYRYMTTHNDGHNAVAMTTVGSGPVHKVDLDVLDGFGRTLRSSQGSVTGVLASLSDIDGNYGTITLYDAVGRPSRQYAPVPFDAGMTHLSSIPDYYDGDTAPFTAYTYNGAVSRPASVTIPGEEYAGHPASILYGFNTGRSASGEAAQYRCRRYKAAPGNSDYKLTLDGYWPEGALSVTRTVDGDGRTSLVFTDYLGQKVLVRRIISGNNFADTNYVYDDAGQLVYILMPEASHTIIHDGFYGASSHTSLKQYAYVYRYNDRMLPCSSRLPGCEPVEYVYDATRRLTLTQDGNRRERGVAAFTWVDEFGRDVIEGECLYSSSLAETISNMRTYCTASQSLSGRLMGYGMSLSLPAAVANRVTYYDHYAVAHSSSMGVASLLAPLDSIAITRNLPRRNNTTGLVTATLTRILPYTDFDGSTSTPSTDYVAALNLYDSHERLCGTVSTIGDGTFDITTIEYDNANQPLTCTQTRVPAEADDDEYVLTQSYTYAYPGRTDAVLSDVSGAVQAGLHNSYDEIGRLSRVRYGDSQDGTVDYTYNVNGSIASINTSTGFQQILSYASPVANGATPCYNGNISAITWHGVDPHLRTYTYEYDNLNRLTSADYSQSSFNSSQPSLLAHVFGPVDYSCTYAYDRNSSPTRITRKGLTDVSKSGSIMTMRFGTVDDLTLTYNGLKLKKVTDDAAALAYTGAEDFNDGADESVEYSYDANGNITADLNKGIESIVYNSLNLPARINLTDGSYAIYTYAADGTLLRRDNATYLQSPTRPMIRMSTTYYYGAFEYESLFNSSPSLSRINTASGFIKSNGNVHCYIKDYQGNIRQVVDLTAQEVVQENHYYPYGMLFGESSASTLASSNAWMSSGTVGSLSFGAWGNGTTKNPYKYGEKEHISFRGVNLNDFAARYHDPALAIFTTPDPLSSITPDLNHYLYCSADPVNRIDPSGMTDVLNESERMRQYINDGVNQVIQLSDTNFDALSNIGFDPSHSGYKSILAAGVLRDDLFPTIVNVLADAKFIGWGHDGCYNCRDLAEEQNNIKTIGDSSKYNVALKGKNNKIIPQKNVSDGINYMKSELIKGFSLVCGVNNSNKVIKENTNKATNHFINIVGIGFEIINGKAVNYISYYDNGTKHG